MINMENVVIRNMKEEDSAEVLEMMKVFYASPALLSDPSEDVMKRDIADCLGDNPFIECFVFENNTGVIMGYSMVAHRLSIVALSFSSSTSSLNLTASFPYILSRCSKNSPAIFFPL